MSVWYETTEDGMRPIVCRVCEMPVQAMTHPNGSRTLRCPCGRTSMTMLSEGSLDLGIVRDSKLIDRPIRPSAGPGES